MKKVIRIVLLLLLGGIVVLQFFQPERNRSAADPEVDLVAASEVPEDVAAILVNSCYDCHSNRTEYPWYSYIQPAGWYLENHIREGKEELNMAGFGLLEDSRKIRALSEICEVLEEGSMPLKSYLLIHRQARLTDEEIEAVCAWSEQEAMRILSAR